MQMVTQAGENVNVFAVKGNFDDTQNGVKAIFTDSEMENELAENGIMLSSANSINWGRLAPQIVYYYWAYSRLVKSGTIKAGDKIDFCVPTGNFGNILAGYMAKKSGLPINRLVCASNENNVLTDFLETGIYDKNRTFHLTDSPSMDILISSNLERLLYMMSDDKTVKAGTPVLKNVVCEAEVIAHGKDSKIVVFKYKAKKNERKKQGHRQPFTRVKILSIKQV
jgi:threonine synthase